MSFTANSMKFDTAGAENVVVAPPVDANLHYASVVEEVRAKERWKLDFWAEIELEIQIRKKKFRKNIKIQKKKFFWKIFQKIFFFENFFEFNFYRFFWILNTCYISIFSSAANYSAQLGPSSTFCQEPWKKRRKKRKSRKLKKLQKINWKFEFSM